MSWGLVKDRTGIKEPRRVAEARKMFEALSKDPEHLTAKIDMASTNVYRYARQLGYKVRATKIDAKNSYVWIVEPQSKSKEN